MTSRVLLFNWVSYTLYRKCQEFSLLNLISCDVTISAHPNIIFWFYLCTPITHHHCTLTIEEMCTYPKWTMSTHSGKKKEGKKSTPHTPFEGMWTTHDRGWFEGEQGIRATVRIGIGKLGQLLGYMWDGWLGWSKR